VGRREWRADRPQLRHHEPVLVARFSPDGSHILTGSVDKAARLWDAATGRTVGPPVRHHAAIDRAVFSPDGRGLATGSRDGLIRVCQTSRRQPDGPALK
jgi:WD40 repeat protein